MEPTNKIPFPQANNVLLMIEMLKTMDSGDNKSFTNLNIVNRQVHYYKSSLMYFDLLDKKERLTLKGKYLIQEKTLDLQKTMFRNTISLKPVFSEVEEYYESNNALPDIETVQGFIYKYFNYNHSTLKRRASGVLSIYKFIIKQ
jgi:hypothetical protein